MAVKGMVLAKNIKIHTLKRHLTNLKQTVKLLLQFEIEIQAISICCLIRLRLLAKRKPV